MIVKSIAKTYASEQPLPNEDACHLFQHKAALSDGAGGTGIAAQYWAATLVENIPEEPIRNIDTLTAWLKPLAIAFFEQQEQSLATPYQISKLYQEGASATLAAVWLVEGYWHFFGYGDSHWFVFSANHELSLSLPYQSAEDFLGSTHLLNPISMPSSIPICTATIKQQAGNIYFLASDEIAKHILGTLAQKPNQLAKFIASIQGNETDFISYIESQPDIGSDDYSVIYWEDNSED